MARSIPFSPTETSRGLHWIDSLGFDKGRGYDRRSFRVQAFLTPALLAL